jgi:hypothetical protein
MAKTVGDVKSAGIQHVSIARVNSSFYPVGTAPDPETIANQTTLNAIHVQWADNLGLAQPTQAVEKTQGGNQPGPSIVLGIDDRGESTLTLAMDNEQLSALVEGISNDASTISDWMIKGHNPRLDTFYDYMIIASAKVVGDGIAEHWVNKIYLASKMVITEYMNLSQSAGTNSHMITFTLTPNESTRTPWGALWSTTGVGFTSDKTDYCEIRSDAPLTVTYYKGENADTGFTVGFRPTTSDVASASNAFSKDGVTVTTPTVTSISTTTGAVVTPSMAAAEEWVVLYETLFVAI